MKEYSSPDELYSLGYTFMEYRMLLDYNLLKE